MDERYQEWVAAAEIANPAEAIANAKALLIYTMRLAEAVEQTRLQPGMLVERLQVATGDPGTPGPGDGGPGLVFVKRYAPKELLVMSRNLIFGALAVSAIATDSALKAKFHARHPEDVSETGSLRNVMYMIRCAFAHDPLRPTWDCRDPFTTTYKIPRVGLTFNGLRLNGQPVGPNDFGGYETYFAMLDFAFEVVRADAAPA